MSPFRLRSRILKAAGQQTTQKQTLRPEGWLAKSDAVAIADETRTFSFVANIPKRLFPAFVIVVDPPRYETLHLGISKNQVVSAVDADAELLSRPLDQKGEVAVLEIHIASCSVDIANGRGSNPHPFAGDR
ncbi:MAG: hypothetical protein EON59_15295 [Alphaproteobacteria bacterium]|nr:MAG: hypothetical protein EON59_15295 [Alphaproteobacteria bacterium]